MPHQVNYNGTVHEFPDEATPDMISKALGLSGKTQNNNADIPKFMTEFSPLSKAREFLGNPSPIDLAKAGLVGAGEGVEGIRNTTRKLMGKPIQDDNSKLKELLNANKNPSMMENLVSGGVKYAPAGIGAFFGAPAAIATGAGYGAVQNPENPLRGAAEGGAFSALPSLFGLAKKLNPMNLTYGKIAKNIVNKQKEMQTSYSKKYNDLFKSAKDQGYGNFENLEVPKLNIDVLKKYTTSPNKNLESLMQFSESPSLESAQQAISELGHIIRPLEGKKSLPPFQRKQYEAAEEAKEYIQKSMFKNSSGELNKELLNNHSNIQQGYLEDVIPYSEIEALKEFKKGEKFSKVNAKQVIDELSKNNALLNKHKAIKVRKSLPYVSTAIGSAGVGALLNKLLRKED